MASQGSAAECKWPSGALDALAHGKGRSRRASCAGISMLGSHPSRLNYLTMQGNGCSCWPDSSCIIAGSLVVTASTSDAQVMSGEEGLQGSWFTGTINQLQHGFALVAYDELNVSEDSDEKLQEWFSLPGATEDSQALLDPTHDAHLGPDFQIRPPPPAEVGQWQQHSCIYALHMSYFCLR